MATISLRLRDSAACTCWLLCRFEFPREEVNAIAACIPARDTYTQRLHSGDVYDMKFCVLRIVKAHRIEAMLRI
jgi:hypothetical protein